MDRNTLPIIVIVFVFTLTGIEMSALQAKSADGNNWWFTPHRLLQTNLRETDLMIRDKCDIIIIIQGSTGGISDLTRDQSAVSVEVPEEEMASLNMGSCNVGE